MRSQLSKICRLLICFGVMKVALLVALAAGYSLPEFQFLNLSTEQVASNENTAQQEVAKLDKQIPVAAEVSEKEIAPNAIAPINGQDPQGAAAVLAAKQHKPSQDRVMAEVAQSPAIIQTVGSRVKPQAPEQDSPTWWNNILAITSLPVPLLGLDQVAYAATLNAPPPPAIPSTQASSPFAPPQQNPAPAAPAQVLPAGTAGPQVGGSQSNLLVPNPNPPAPNVNAYVSPEDPMQKQQELARREQELLMLKKQTEQRLKELQAAERKVQDMLKEAKSVEGSKIDVLTNMYINMKAKQAARAIETLSEETAAKILINMKPKQAGEILSYTNPAKTAKLTEILSRMKINN